MEARWEVDPSDPAAAFWRSPPVFRSTPQARIDVLMVSLPEAKALALLPDLRNPQRIVAAQQRLLEMIARGEATLIDWPQIQGHHNSRVVTEDIAERRYPVEFDQPMDPGVAAATTFETKNTGYTLEAESVVSPDCTAVSINLVPQNVIFDRMIDYPAGQDTKGKTVTIQQPIFRTHKIQTNLTLRHGERRLIYFGKPLTSEAPLHLFILGAKIIPAIK